MKSVICLFMMIFILLSQDAYPQNKCSVIYTGKPRKATDLYVKEKVNDIEEHLLREGSTAAHLYLDSSVDPYLFVAFPSGNSGVALWLKSPEGQAKLEAMAAPTAHSRSGGLNGIAVQLRSKVKSLVISDSVLGSMRFIRDRELNVAIPSEVRTKDIRFEKGRLIFDRLSINGLARYVLELEPTNGTQIIYKDNVYQLVSNQEVTFKVSGFTSETPLTPIPMEDFFKESALKTMDPKKLQAFSFLLYKEKLMAGSPRYFSKFGRDSIFSLRVLMDVMKPEAIEYLLTATLSSMNPTKGWVSHEQHEGDFVSYVRRKSHQKYKNISSPIEDYKMIDDDFAFVIVLGKYLMDYPDRAKTFLNSKEARGLVHRDLIKNLFNYVVNSTSEFVKEPGFKNLIGLKGHEKTGQWRDSENGLAGGKYPFDVNTALVPAALKTMAELTGFHTSDFFDAEKSAQLHHSFEIWNSRALPLFEVRLSAPQVAVLGEQYLKDLKIPRDQWPSPPKEETVFFAISLSEEGLPIPIMHSDDSMMMTFGYPSPAYLSTVSQRLRRQEPYGLLTPVGVLVANAAFAPKNLQLQFDSTKYHGHVSWAMQEDLLIYGLRRQQKRPDLSQNLKAELQLSEQAIEQAAAAKASMGGTEVFSISYHNGQYVALPFAGDAKSNSNQLWSHLRLGF